MNKTKLQVLLDEMTFNTFEAVRKRKFSSTTRQFLLEQIIKEWLSYQTKGGRI